MSMFSKLMGKVFGSNDEAKTILEEEAKTEAPEKTEGKALKKAEEKAEGKAEGKAESEPVVMVDIEADLNAKAAAHAEDLDWKYSIVDLLKLVGLDSSYSARKEMALELGYSQADIAEKGSAQMNIWLHKEVMKKIADNGGKIPSKLSA